jgi:hypothetical protein
MKATSFDLYGGYWNHLPLLGGIAESFKPEDIIGKSDCFSQLGYKTKWCGKSRNDFWMTTNVDGKCLL